jgi:hypothetical protein
MAKIRERKVEQATAAPGETRDVHIPTESGLCEEPVTIAGWVHPCDREARHKGAHSFKGATD